MMVSTSRPMVRAVLKGHTFNVDPLSINTIGTLAPMQPMVICRGLVEWLLWEEIPHLKRKVKGEMEPQLL